MPAINHYSAYCHYNYSDKLNLKPGFSYYYDDLLENGKMELIEEKGFISKIEKISKFNQFILLYAHLN